MRRFFSFAQPDGIAWHDTAEEAREGANEALKGEREHCLLDGYWSDEVTEICWGEVREVATEDTRTHVDEDEDGQREEVYTEYELRPVEPVTPSNVVPFPPNRVEAVAGVASVRQLLHHIVVLDTVERERLEHQLEHALLLLGGGA
jgi:hypothetical protein